MQDNYQKIRTISFFNQKFLAKEETKIKFLEGRLSSPNNEGMPPADYTPLKEKEIENIKTQILILPPSGMFTDFTNKKSFTPTKTKKSNNDIKIEKFLNKKRNFFAPNENRKEENKDLDQNSNIKNNGNQNDSNIYSTDKFPQVKNENNSKLFDSKNFFNNNNSLFNSTNDKNRNKFKLKDKKHLNKQNKNNSSNTYLNSNKNNYNNNNSVKSKTIDDYYKTTSIKRSYMSTNNKATNLTRNNNSFEKLKNYKENNNIKQLLKILDEQNLIVEQKEKEISSLKLSHKENEKLISELKKNQQDADIEIKRCRTDISYMLKEISNLKRENKKKWLNEQQYYLGKISTTLHYNNNKAFECWEDGKDIIEINKKLAKIKIQKDELQNQKDKYEENIKNPKNNIISFKLNILEREEKELNNKLENLEKKKLIYLQELNLLNQEMNCTFAPHKKEGLPLLNDRYQIISLLGKGGYSEVYKAYDLENHMYVACKLNQLNLNWKEDIKKSYIKHTIRESQIHRNFNHRKIVKLYNTIEIDNNSFCTILEYCSGPDLSTYIKKNKFISEKEAKIIISQILEGLLYLNKLPNKIIHYDLKPENILFHNMEIKISDFGLSKIIENNSDKIQLTSQGVGTYWYLPPECFEEKKNIEISSKVDIWSLGVILYEMIYKKKPFGDNYSQDKLIKERIMKNAKVVNFPEKPSISDDCKNFIKHCLAHNQEDRYDVFQAINSSFIKKK
mgnify:CR=1 FL=1